MDKNTLLQQIRLYDHHYHTLGEAIVPDSVYDSLKSQLRSIDPSLCEYVGSPILESQFAPVALEPPMLSLSNCMDIDDLETFMSKIPPDTEYVAEPKMDGLAMELSYTDGVLQHAATRGNGSIGENVTANATTIEGVLTVLGVPVTIKVRGEVVLLKERLAEINSGRIAKGLAPYANCRNAAAGGLRNTDPLETKYRRLSFKAYTLVDSTYGTELADMEYLGSLGFDTVETRVVKSGDDTVSLIAEWTDARDIVDVDIDGIVFKTNSKKLQDTLGSTSSSPRWARAYKFPAMLAVTRLRDITWQVGRSGILTPVAELEPVELCGVVVKRATLHNMSEIVAKDIQLNDMVVIKRAGDVIPEVTGSLPDFRHGNTYPVTQPMRCPACDGPIVCTPKAIKCVSASCTAQKIRKLVFFFSKSGIDADGVGKVAVQTIFEAGLASEPHEFFQLSSDQLIGLPLIGQKKAGLMVNSLSEAAMKCDDVKLLTAIGIPFVGEDTSKILIGAFGSIENILSANIESLMAVDGIGPGTAESIMNSTYAQHILALLRPYITHKVNTKDSAIERNLAGKTYIITGTFDKPRPVLKKYIEERGGKVVSQASSTTQFALVGEAPGQSKMSKIEKYGIPIIGLSDIL